MILECFNVVLKMLLPSYYKKLMRVIYDNFVKTYILMCFTLSTGYNNKETPELIEKIEKEKAFVGELFTNYLSAKETEENQGMIQLFLNCLKDPIEDVIVHMVKFSVKFKDDFNDNCIVAFSKTESDYEAERRLHCQREGDFAVFNRTGKRSAEKAQ